MAGVNADIVAMSFAERVAAYGRLCLERLEAKSGVIEAMHASSRGEWQQTIYRVLLRYMDVASGSRQSTESCYATW